MVLTTCELKNNDMNTDDYYVIMRFICKKEYCAGLRDAILVNRHSSDIAQSTMMLEEMVGFCEEQKWGIMKEMFMSQE